MSDDKSRYTVLMEDHLKERAKENTEHGELSERVRAVFKEAAYGDEIAERDQLSRELEELRQRKDDLRSEIRAKQAELADVQQRETRLEERLAEKKSREDRYETMLGNLETIVREQGPVTQQHPIVRDAAGLADTDAAEVIADLREECPDLPDRAFTSPSEASMPWRPADSTDLRSAGGDEDA